MLEHPVKRCYIYHPFLAGYAYRDRVTSSTTKYELGKAACKNRVIRKFSGVFSTKILLELSQKECQVARSLATFSGANKSEVSVRCICGSKPHLLEPP